MCVSFFQAGWDRQQCLQVAVESVRNVLLQGARTALTTSRLAAIATNTRTSLTTTTALRNAMLGTVLQGAHRADDLQVGGEGHKDEHVLDNHDGHDQRAEGALRLRLPQHRDLRNK